MKRIGALFTALLLIDAGAANVFAAENVMTLEAGDVSVPCDAGIEICVPVTATVNTGYVSALFTVEWDPDTLELTGVDYTELAPDLLGGGIMNSGSLTLRVGDPSRRDNIIGTGIFLTLRFRVGEHAQAGDYPVTLTHADVLDTDLKPVAVTAIAGKVSLTSAADDSQPDSSTQTERAAEPVIPTEFSELSAEGSIGTIGESADGESTAQPASTRISDEKAAGESGENSVLWLIPLAAAIIVCAVGALIFIRIRRKEK